MMLTKEVAGVKYKYIIQYKEASLADDCSGLAE